MNLDDLRSCAQRFFSDLDARLARTPAGDSSVPEENTAPETGRLKELLSVDLEQSKYGEIVEGVPRYGWMALDAARVSGVSVPSLDLSKRLNSGLAVGLHSERQPKIERNLGLLQSATERAVAKERQLMGWQFNNGVDLAEEVLGLCQSLQEVEVLLELKFVERVHIEGEAFFEAINTHEKLQKQLGEVHTTLTRTEELMRILRSQWSEHKSLILSVLPLSGALKMQDLEQRVSNLVKCRIELTHLLQVWAADNLHSQKASMLLSNRDYDRALAEEEEISIRRWQDIESSRVGEWVTRKAAEFAKTHLLDNYNVLNERFTSDIQFRQEFERLPRAVSAKVRADAKRVEPGPGAGQTFAGLVAGILMVVPLVAMFLVYVHWSKSCPFCGRDHSSLYLAHFVAKFPANMVTVPGGTLHPGRELRYHYKQYLPIVEKDPGRRPEPQVLGAFEIGQYEVTYGEWKKVRAYAADHGYSDLKKAGKGTESHSPVTHVTWYEVVKWCNAKSEMEGLMPVYEVAGETFKDGDYGSNGSTMVTQRFGANGYRLPTGAEWEWAAYGGQSPGSLYSGSSDPSAVAWYDNNTNGPRFVGNKKANELGIHDMIGNVSEWCWDPEGDGSTFRQVRGGSYRTRDTLFLRIPQRRFLEPDHAFADVGFRLVRGFVPKQEEHSGQSGGQPGID